MYDDLETPEQVANALLAIAAGDGAASRQDEVASLGGKLARMVVGKAEKPEPPESFSFAIDDPKGT